MRLLLCVLASCAGPGCAEPPGLIPPQAAPPGMVWIPPGVFEMGSEAPGSRADERPVRTVTLAGFWMDRTEVTNAQFARFVEATGYVTTAERPVDADELMAQLPAGTPDPPPELLVPGALVFDMPDGGRPGGWRWAAGACWRDPLGDGTSPAPDHPVVQVSWDDATAYAVWAGKALPTEAQFERAARAGVDGRVFIWGDELNPAGAHLTNIWQGRFPSENRGEDGFVRTAPVASFEPNAFGLFDMAGNVWEWTADWYHPNAYRMTPRTVTEPAGAATSLDPLEPSIPKRVVRGGSYLCSSDFCTGYRPSARMKTSPDTGLCHTGFRCVMPSAEWERRRADDQQDPDPR